MVTGCYLTHSSRVSKGYISFDFPHISDTCKYTYKESIKHNNFCHEAYHGASSHPFKNIVSEIKIIQKTVDIILSSVS